MEKTIPKGPRVHQKLNSEDLFYLLKEQDQVSPKKSVNRKCYRCDCQGRYCDGFSVSLNPTLVEKIDGLEKQLKKTVQIISGVRCEKRNVEVDGSKHSFHLLGRAADIRCETISIDELAAAAEIVGLLVIRDYRDDVVHCQWND
ncbi:D-Ala-D-Ala carboxypeptidase family metallohydrolase [Acetobacterium sp.]|jgi:hypothetical protein|uniref:D-Ala-D-Ala carboxypeptidase family metallohydrolase n=1 Tax=Acetobacterium sp. TaxID=1872094 RepID=UPI000CBEA74D|nr:D-Ala-D-Ala carboxypeptidase family metallohydrolase [Acetobacterium sp.]MDO9492264.1 D-Ala-D-Ala carboxypeptidase family metallohydrolase [Acetobacterium sp.]PKM75285.1 MAG: hypothetical protein CVU92_02245 [Firmicutes bacterium HGW-Firmicutes-17]